ncbi:MAG: caspase family protein [Syntrophales bacterium]|nr:caspase family protein [Syntrophales bacterium]
MSEKISLSKGIVCVMAFLAVGLFASAGLLAAETRGLRVVAKDPVSGQQTEVKLYNKSYAVIIGIDQYQNLSFSEQLTYAVRDAKGVEDVLRKNFKFDKIITLYNKQATKDNILKVLMEDLANELGEEDALFVFWAGHGNQEKTRTGDLGYLIPYDGFKAKLQSNISMNTLKEDISKKLAAKHVFYVMDACYGGLLTATRGLEKQTKRDLAYLQEITREPVRQVLTAGGKDQEVLDGGPKGHSVFTGRLIEELENAGDFITANELQAKVKEKVFSDANARNHKQTPGYGALYGVGDFVFVPSIEQKVEDTQSKVASLQKELDRLKDTEEAALKAQDERAKRQTEIEKSALEARIKVEQLKQQALEEERRKREREDLEQKRQEEKLVQKKKADEGRLALLKRDVEEKRKVMGGTTLSSLSPEKTLAEMQQIDAKIKEIREQFRKELANGINQIVQRFNTRFLKLADAKKDEFETEGEFNARIAKETGVLNSEQGAEFAAFQDRLEKEYTQQIVPFIEQLKRLSGNEFTLAAENLVMELGTYDGASNTYPVSIRAKQPIKGILVAANANIPIPRDEAREFKQHFQNNMLRPEIKGNFYTPEVFMIAQAYVIDDATTKQYNLFAARFVDLGNGTLYDPQSKLIWSKKGNENNITWYAAQDYIKRLNEQAYLGFRDWRMPSKEELATLVQYAKSAGYGSGGKTIADFLNREGFSGISASWYWTSDHPILFENGTVDSKPYNNSRVLPVRSGSGTGASGNYIGISIAQQEEGVFLASVVQDGPAAAAGLLAGDRIIAIDGEYVSDTNSVLQSIKRKKPGDTVKMQISRGHEQKTVKIIVGKK